MSEWANMAQRFENIGCIDMFCEHIALSALLFLVLKSILALPSENKSGTSACTKSAKIFFFTDFGCNLNHSVGEPVGLIYLLEHGVSISIWIKLS